LHLRHLEGSPKMAHQKHRRSWLSAWAYLRQKKHQKNRGLTNKELHFS
jgi:hypothetical protein